MMEQLRKRLSLNKQNPTHLSGFVFGGPLGPKFELFSENYHVGSASIYLDIKTVISVLNLSDFF